MTSIVLRERDMLVDGNRIEVFGGDASHRLVDALGPELFVTEAGVRGVFRTAHWLKSGVVVVSQDVDDDLIMLYVCFSPDSSPYPQHAPEVAVFDGTVQIGERTFRGNESEQTVRQSAGIEGMGGMLSTRVGELFVGLYLPKTPNRFLERKGPRRLQRVSAEWGGVKPFKYPERKRSP